MLWDPNGVHTFVMLDQATVGKSRWSNAQPSFAKGIGFDGSVAEMDADVPAPRTYRHRSVEMKFCFSGCTLYL